MAIQPKNGARELALNDDRDNSGQKARPQFEVPASTSPSQYLFEEAERGLRVSYRACVAEYLGIGKWLVFIGDRIEIVHMGPLFRPAELFFSGFVNEFLGPVVVNQPPLSV